MAKTLLSLVKESGSRSLAVTGMAKNCGKTTVLDHLILEAAAEGTSLGVTSAGRDGEKVDAVTGLAKPAIWVPAGSLVVGARGPLEKSAAHIEPVAQTGFHTPLGPILLGRVSVAGSVEIIGGNRHEQTRAAIDLMQGHGAHLVLVDGAANRVFLAAPTLVDGVILATGAAVAPSIDAVLAQTKFALDIWGLPPVASDALRDVAADVAGAGRTAVIDRHWEIRHLTAPSALGHAADLAGMVGDKTRAVIVGGALTDSLVDGIMAARRRNAEGLEIVVADPTRVLTGRRAFHRFLRRGGTISVLRPVRMLALTLNPTSPYWPGFNQNEFFERAREAVHPLPVFDVVLGRSSH